MQVLRGLNKPSKYIKKANFLRILSFQEKVTRKVEGLLFANDVVSMY